MTQNLLRLASCAAEVLMLLTLGGALTVVFAACGVPAQATDSAAFLLVLSAVFTSIRFYLSVRVRRTVHRRAPPEQDNLNR